jgi:ATP-dependent Clp protease ATP-binding subunit ClpB
MYSILFQYEQTRHQREVRDRLRFPLEKRLKQHFVGQDGPITTVAAGRQMSY